MKKLINRSEDIVSDVLSGFTKAHKDRVKLIPDTTYVVRAQPKEKGKVKLVIGNGAGHEPAVIGWVGKGMFDMNVVGDVFTAPSANKIFKGLQAIDDGSPILLIVQNHAGDVLNANAAYKKAVDVGMNIQKVLFYDDIASAPKGSEQERRGIGGMIFYVKIVGALAEAGATLDECVAMFEHVRDNTRTYAAAFSSCTHPQTGQRMFEYLDGSDLIELGMGVHGEGAGENQIPMPTASKFAEIMGEALMSDKPYVKGDEILLCVNGAGSTTVMEMSILYNELDKFFTEKGITVAAGTCGNFLTTQELSGVSISICKIDDESLALWQA